MREVKSRSLAFSIVEILVVVGILVALMGLAVPAINGLTGSGGRAGAINIIMNTLEQARVAALESSTNVYVVFADANHPDQDKRFRAMLVMRDYVPTLDTNLVPPPRYVPLTKWIFLPKGISFKNVSSSLLNAFNMTSLELDTAQARFIVRSGSSTIPATQPYVQFTAMGAITQPSDSNHLKVFTYEGFFDGNKDVPTPKVEGALLDQISLAPFTGRAQLDVVSEPH